MPQAALGSGVGPFIAAESGRMGAAGRKPASRSTTRPFIAAESGRMGAWLPASRSSPAVVAQMHRHSVAAGPTARADGRARQIDTAPDASITSSRGISRAHTATAGGQMSDDASITSSRGISRAHGLARQIDTVPAHRSRRTRHATHADGRPPPVNVCAATATTPTPRPAPIRQLQRRRGPLASGDPQARLGAAAGARPGPGPDRCRNRGR